MSDSFTPVGTNLLVRRAEMPDLKSKMGIVIPDGQGGTRRARGKGSEARAAEFDIVKVGVGRDESETPLVEGLKPGMRVAVGQAALVPVFVDGEQLFILDALHVMGIVVRGTDTPTPLEPSDESKEPVA